MPFSGPATGKVSRWSDIDLMVVKKTNKRFYDRIGEVLQITNPREAIDVLVYTPEELRDMMSYSYFVRDEVVKKGKVLYEKNA